MEIFDTIIANGRIVDGTGSPGFYGDVGLRNGRIAAIGQLAHANAKERIDAAGMIVAPGHVTQHSHYDAALFWDPYCSNSGEHGVTTLLNANCGFGFAPVRAADRERTMAMLETTEQIPLAQQRAGLTWDWETFPEYIQTLRRLPKGVNVLTFVPLNPLLVFVMGVEAKGRRPSAGDMREIGRLINEAMDAGAVGISMSVMGEAGNSHVDSDGAPMPTDLLHPDDVVAIARIVGERGEGLVQMLSKIGGYGDRGLTERVAEALRDTGVRVLHNALITINGRPEMLQDDIAWLDGMRARGLDVVGAALVNRGWVEFGVLDLAAIAGRLSAVREIIAAGEGGLALIADPDFVSRFTNEYAAMGAVTGATDFASQTIIELGPDPALQPYLGRSLGEVAAELGLGVVAAMFDLGVRSKGAVQFKTSPYSATDPAQTLMVMKTPSAALGVSDGGAHTKSFSNGHYATELLIWLVREEKLTSLEEMHFQLSLKVARTLQLVDRGAILPGFHADILIYDLDELFIDWTRYEVVHDMPEGDWRRQPKAGGYRRILVNGVTTHERDKSSGATPGELICLAA